MNHESKVKGNIMRIKQIKLKHFKRFDDLTINLGDNPRKIIALVGPNGCGKSSVFDAFEEKTKDYKGSRNPPPPDFYSKRLYSINSEEKSETYNKNDAINIIREDESTAFDKKCFYIRSPYRFTPQLNVLSIKALPDIIDDTNRPSSSIAMDSRLLENYERLLGNFWNDVYGAEMTGKQWEKENVDKINAILASILDIKISNLGNPTQNKGQLYFEKETSKDFPFENLSSGEKEVVDIIIDLVVKTSDFNDTVYCIDEPELHLNTSIQRKLLIEIEKLIPDNCQLWVATHSIGFLRALQVDLIDKSSILDFSEKNYFSETAEMFPMAITRKNWQRIFQIALEDLTGLMAPDKIIYCEGKIQNSLDEKMFNIIFEKNFHDTLFLSSGNQDSVQKYAVIALTVLNKAFSDVEIIALIDRDDDDLEIAKNGQVTVKKFTRREFENYLLDKEILKKHCSDEGKSFNETEYDNLVTDIMNDDVKARATDILRKSCGDRYDRNTRVKLAKLITEETDIYKVLKREIMG